MDYGTDIKSTAQNNTFAVRSGESTLFLDTFSCFQGVCGWQNPISSFFDSFRFLVLFEANIQIRIQISLGIPNILQISRQSYKLSLPFKAAHVIHGYSPDSFSSHISTAMDLRLYTFLLSSRSRQISNAEGLFELMRPRVVALITHYKYTLSIRIRKRAMHRDGALKPTERSIV